VYIGLDGETSTDGASTIYEVYIYTTTQSIDIVGDSWQCGANSLPVFRKKFASETATTLTAVPAYVEAKATSTI
jgi:hypothetical protein